MPAEWEPHEGTWIAWPHNKSDWPGKFAAIPFVVAEVVRQLARVEMVNIIVADAAMEKRARLLLRRVGIPGANLRFHRWPTNRIWTRDSGCIFVRGSAELLSVTFGFNAWAKYSDWERDAAISALMATAAGARAVQPQHGGAPVVLEGGSIDVNGAGTLIATEECLLSDVQERNSGMAREDYERVFREFLGVKHVIWLGKGISGDDTHGHVDDLARFTGPATVVAASEPDRSDPNHEPLAENLRRLRSATDESRTPLQVIELPMPRPIAYQGRRLPASYANFYVANGLVLVPTFNDPKDRAALNILAELFPEREVVGIYCGDLVWGFGAIHCMTQQQPIAQAAAFIPAV
jgi:agmatine deiminase